MAYINVRLGPPYIDDDEVVMAYPHLHHYTTLGALRGILADGGIWSTHYRRLNDTSEFELAAGALASKVFAETRKAQRRKIEMRSRIKNRILRDHGSIDLFLEKDAHTLPKAIRKLADQELPMHCASFAHHHADYQRRGGRLTLWLAYGSENGVALEFDTKKLLRCLSHLKAAQRYHALFVTPVTYGDDDLLFKARLQGMQELSDIHQFLSNYFLKGQRPAKLPDNFHELNSRFLVTSIAHKHPAFEDEREVRLVASPILHGEHEDERADVDWVNRTPGESKILIKCATALTCVMIGPSPNQDGVKHNVIALLEKYSRRDVTIRLSDIPFRAQHRALNSAITP